MKPTKNITTLLEIMAHLRDPEKGCPWDVKQDFKSIAPYSIEEAYEVADAIEREDFDDLRLELGDLLLQVVYHAQMAKEQGHFDFGDVVEGINSKMIRRHPHVFGTEDKTADEFTADGLENGTWERIKAEEKAEAAERRALLGLSPKNTGASILDGVPSNLPATTVAHKLQSKAASVGFDWSDPAPVLGKIKEELDEFLNARKANNKEQMEAEFGDLLFALINFARHEKIDPEKALRKTNHKFRKRFAFIEKRLDEEELAFSDVDLERLDGFWNEAKQSETKQ